MQTRKVMFGTRTEFSTTGTDLGSIVRFNPINNNSFSFSFVLDEALQLEETPITKNPVHLFSFSLFPDAFQVFHHNLVSIEIGNNVFTNVVIVPSHKPSLFPRDFFKQSSRTSCAFGLKFTTQIFELPFDLFDFSRIIKPAVRTDGKVVYSKVNAQNNVLRTTVLLSGSNLFRECEQEKTSTFFINPKQTFFNIPTKIFFVAVRDGKWDFDSAFNSCQTQDIVFEGSRTREIISHTYSIDGWFGFSFFDHTTSLFDTSDSELALQSNISEVWVNKRMEFDIVSDMFIPSSINTELQSFTIYTESFDYFRSCFDSNLCSDSCSHIDIKEEQVFKCFDLNEVKSPIPPTAKAVGILGQTS